tara:strand:+ start:340 stop:576 length:237 start_codon:yes stop_codon:yes gene_type:complete
MATCYMLVWLNTCSGTVAGIALSDRSDPPRPVDHLRPLTLAFREGETLLQARENLMRAVRKDPDLTWAHALLGHPINL